MVAAASAMLSTDPEFEGSSGVLDKGLLLSAEKWPDAGVGLTIHRVAETAVAPALCVAVVGGRLRGKGTGGGDLGGCWSSRPLLLVVVAFLTGVRSAVTRAAAILVAVALQVCFAVAGDTRPAVAAGYELVTFAMSAGALSAASWMSAGARRLVPGDATAPTGARG